MRSTFIAAAIALAGVSGVAIAQDMAGGGMSGMASAGSMTASDVGLSPMTGTPSGDYAKMAADGDLYEMTSSKIALTKSKDPQVKQFAQQMITDHTKTTNALKAAIPMTKPKVNKPPMMLSASNADKIKALRAAPPGQFDKLYLQQQYQSHQTAWALHKGYATDGQDPALRQVATSAVPVVEQHLQMLKGMPGAMPGSGSM